MKKMNVFVSCFVLMFALVSCSKVEHDYQNVYDLDNVESFYIHPENKNPIFWLENGDILMLDDVNDRGSDIHNLFGTYDVLDFKEEKADFRKINDSLDLLAGETVVKIMYSSDGWLFLTNLGNVRGYGLSLSGQATYVYRSDRRDQTTYSNLLTLLEGEYVVDMYHKTLDYFEVVVFETNFGNLYEMYDGSLEFTINGHDMYPNNVLGEGVVIKQALMEFRSEMDRYLFVTDEGKVMTYDLNTYEVLDITSSFELEEGEVILEVCYAPKYKNYYVTNYGNVRYFTWEDMSIIDTFTIDLHEGETITDFQDGLYGVIDGIQFFETSEGRYFYYFWLHNKSNFIDLNDYIDLTDDEVINVSLSNYSKGSAGTGDVFYMNEVEYPDFEFILTVETENHIYLLGNLDFRFMEREGITEEFMVLKIK